MRGWFALVVGGALLSAISSAEPSARFEAPFAKLRQKFSSNKAETVADELINGGRNQLFTVEGLARLYKDRYPEMGELRDQAKTLEDLVGVSVDWRLHVEYAKQIKAPPEVVAWVEGRLKKNREELVQFLRKGGYVETDRPLIDRWEKLVAKTEWDGPKKDRAYVLEKLIELTQEIRKEQWNLHDLQNGLHEMRRRTRWLLIYAQALDGLVVFDGRPLVKFQDILNDPVARGQFGKLANGHPADFPILLPREIYLELTKAVEELGNAKDAGEAMFEWLPEALLETGLAKTHDDALKKAEALVQTHPEYLPVWETAETIQERIRRNDKRFKSKEHRGILVALKKRLEDQVDWSKADCRLALGAL